MNKLANFGLFLIGLAAFIFSLGHAMRPSEYQLVQLGDMARNQFLLDKNNGRIWQRVCSGEVKGPECLGEELWAEMFVQYLTNEESQMGQQQKHLNEQNGLQKKKASNPVSKENDEN